MSRANLDALRARAITGLVFCAAENKAELYTWWAGYVSAIDAVLDGTADLLATKDALSNGHQPPAGWQAAWPALTKGLKGLTITQARELLALHGIELAQESVTDNQVNVGQQLEGAVVAPVELNDEPADALGYLDHDSIGHRASVGGEAEA